MNWHRDETELIYERFFHQLQLKYLFTAFFNQKSCLRSFKTIEHIDQYSGRDEVPERCEMDRFDSIICLGVKTQAVDVKSPG